MKDNTCQVLQTTKVIFSRDTPISVSQIERITGLNKRTIQRHVKQLTQAELVVMTINKYDRLERLYQRA